MSYADRLAPVVLVLLLVLAGCNGAPGGTTPTTNAMVSPTETGTSATQTPTGNGSGTPTGPSAADHVTVTNGTLPVNATRTFRRVERLMGKDVDPRPVEVRNLSEWHNSLPNVGAAPINDALGFQNVSVNWSQPSGLTKVTGYVYVSPGEGTPQTIERVLAHEFTHTVQFRANMFPWLDELRTSRVTLDEAKTLRSLQEGGAVYVADAYTKRYLDVQTNSAFVRAHLDDSPTHWSALAPYHFGSQYIAHRIDSPTNLSAVYQHRPHTTEQIMHNYSRSEEPPASLSVEPNVSGSTWRYLANNTLGEMTTRGALNTELSRSRAAAAAAGWGTDELTIFARGTTQPQYGWAWVQRWDNSTEADQAAAAFRTYAHRRNASADYRFRFVRVTDATTALVFGDPAFVTNATVAGTTGNVSVSVGS